MSWHFPGKEIALSNESERNIWTALYSILYTVYSVYSIYCLLYTVDSIQYTVYCIQYTQYTIYCIYCIQYIQCDIYCIQYISSTIWMALYSCTGIVLYSYTFIVLYSYTVIILKHFLSSRQSVDRKLATQCHWSHKTNTWYKLKMASSCRATVFLYSWIPVFLYSFYSTAWDRPLRMRGETGRRNDRFLPQRGRGMTEWPPAGGTKSPSDYSRRTQATHTHTQTHAGTHRHKGTHTHTQMHIQHAKKQTLSQTT